MAGERRAIGDMLQLYFDGLHHSDTALLRQALHPDAIYACASDGHLLRLSMDEYWPIVDARASPASKGESRADRIVSIEFAGPSTAWARVECRVLPKQFIDLLTLVKLDGRWRIIAKVFHYTLAEAG